MPRSGTGRIYQRGNVYWIDYSFRGKRYRESSESTKRGDATALLKKRMGEQSTGKVTGPTEERTTFEDLERAVVDDYKMRRLKSLRRVRGAFKNLRSAFARESVLAITDARVRTYVVDRQQSGAADSTIQNELAALRRGFNLLGLSHKPKVPNLNPKNARKGFFEAADLERVIRELPTALRPAVRFAYLTGWRKSEVLALPWSDVDFVGGEVRLWDSKNDEGRAFPFHALPPLKALLDDQRERTRTIERERGEIIPHVFHRDGHPIRSMDAAWRAACKRAGLAGWLFHDLRRSAVRNLERAGVSRSVAMELTGHKTEAVYRRYAITDSASQAEGVAKLAKLHLQSAGEPETVTPIREARG